MVLLAPRKPVRSGGLGSGPQDGGVGERGAAQLDQLGTASLPGLLISADLQGGAPGWGCWR